MMSFLSIKSIFNIKLLKRICKRLLFIPQSQVLSCRNAIKYFRLRIYPYLYKKRFNVKNLTDIMEEMGMTRGSVIFIHSSWDEFYNFNGNEVQLIEKILDIIGPDGTLAMPAYPLLRKNKIFNLRHSVTRAGILQEAFRKYNNVKRSINVQHSVCAIGKNAEYLLFEHHLGETCWDEKSPYYKLASLNALVFSLGLRKYYIGTMVHCVESVLRMKVPYFRDFFNKEKTCFYYSLDNNSPVEYYYQYDMNENNPRKNYFFGNMIIANRYFTNSYYRYSKISNLQISMFRANLVIPKMIELGAKGNTIYKKPSKRGYVFKKK